MPTDIDPRGLEPGTLAPLNGGPTARTSSSGRHLALGGSSLAVVLALAESVVLAVVGLNAALFGGREPFGGNWEELVGHGTGLLALIESNWQRWDALWYQHVATFGYRAQDGSTAFYPLYPLLARALSAPSGDVVRAELFLSGAAFIGAAWLLWKLSRREILMRARATRIKGGLRRDAAIAPLVTVLLMALFPTGFFFLAPYTESLFLFLTLASFWFMRSGRLWAAGGMALLAGLTRAQGVLLVLPIAFEALRSTGTFDWVRRKGGHPPGLNLLAALLPIAAVVALVSYQVVVLAAGRIGIGSQAPWGFAFVMPWQALQASWDYIATDLGKPRAYIEVLNLVSLGVASVLAIVSVRRIPVAYSLYAIPSLGLLCFRTMSFSPLMSASRYVLMVFPIFMVAGLWLSTRPKLAVAWLVISIGLQLALYQYWVRWGFVA